MIEYKINARGQNERPNKNNGDTSPKTELIIISAAAKPYRPTLSCIISNEESETDTSAQFSVDISLVRHMLKE